MTKHDNAIADRALPLELKNEPGGDPIDELKAAIDALTGDFTEFKSTAVKPVADQADELKTRLDDIEKKMARPAITGKAEEPGAEQKAAFEAFIRKGRESMAADELKFLHVGDDTAGGYLAPEEFGTELLRNVVQFSPIRSIARVSSTGMGSVTLPKRAAGMTATWTGETDPRSETNVTFGQNRYTVREAACYVDVSNQMLEDAALDIAAELNFEFAEEFGKLEATAMVTGTGVADLSGFMQNADVGETVSGHATEITFDGLMDLYHAVPTAYRGNAVWGMNSATLGAVRKIKDGNGNYILTLSGVAGAPASTILGRPIVEMPDMPDVGAGAFPVVFGDFKSGYRIFDRIALSVVRDPFTQATTGKTRFHGRRRLAAGVAKAEALRKLKVAAS